jgi:hypothetical protein
VIIQSSHLTDITLGVDGRNIKAQDSNLEIPATILPTIEMLRTHIFSVNDASQKNTSVMNRLQQSRTNQAALTTGMFNLQAGLWIINVVMATQFNWLATPGTFNGIGVELFLSPAAAIPLLRRIASVGCFVDSCRYRFLLNITAAQLGRIQVTTDITGVGQTSDCDVSVSAERIV